MERTERGSSFVIKDLYYEADEATLIGNYDSVLMDYVAMFRNHPDITFLVKGYVQSYGVDAEADMLLSLERAKTVKEYFIKNGIEADRIFRFGKEDNFSGIKAELIITGKTTDK